MTKLEQACMFKRNLRRLMERETALREGRKFVLTFLL
jgi:hypothetical protein